MLSRAETQASLEECDRKWGLESLYYMARFNLGYTLMRPFPHKDLCRFIETSKRALDLEPRGAFKTSVISQAYSVQRIIKNPNIRILLDSVVLQNSLDNLGVIKSHFESPRVKFLYGDYVGSKWTNEEITVSKRTARNLKEPTVRCASVEKVQVGPHYDLIIADDLVSKENIETPEQRQKVKDHFKLLFSLLEPEGEIVVVGTRWHFEDLYNMIIEEFPEFSTRIKHAEKSGPNGGLYFPERLTKEFLEAQKKRLGRDHYSAQYGNDPAPEDEHSKFQKKFFKPYKDLPEKKYGFILIDPGGKKKKSDEWVFFVAYADQNNEWYFNRFIRGVFRLSKAWDYLFTLHKAIKPLTTALEITGTQHHLEDSLMDEMRRRNYFFHLETLTHAKESKATRIERLIPRYEAGSIWHSRSMGALEDQLRRYPKGKDDIPDAASMMCEVAVAPRSKRQKQKPMNSIDDYVWNVVRNQHKPRHVHPMLGDQ